MLRIFKLTTPAGIPQEEYIHIAYKGGKYTLYTGKIPNQGRPLTSHNSLPDAETVAYALGYTIPVSLLKEAMF